MIQNHANADRSLIMSMKLNARLLQAARQSQVLLILSICLGLVGGIFGVLQARKISALINQVFLQGKDLQSVSRLLIFVFIIILFRTASTWGGELLASSGARKIKQSLRLQIYSHIT